MDYQRANEESLTNLQDSDYQSTIMATQNQSVSAIMESHEQEAQDQTNEINLTNQLLGETQVFILTMRVVLYEFYCIRNLKQEGLLQHQDFDSLEDDIFYIIQRMVVRADVLSIMVVLSRLMNNKTDKQIRKKYRYIEKY